ncbi:nitrous oxide reductase accessory protein NosL [Thalassobacillus devorans]|uniref:nitrous oxide reductase accessory protein NosL n=1 Tax=Thalassobacillus devorans TaxID=279813 RepID=UPI000A1CA1F9|nr:nitrous oxide reductase accessory protein NosL [Thalassobacillus devorans]
MKKWLLFVLLLITAGCAVGEAAGPEEINTSVDSCALCHMGINDEKAASQVIMKDGTPEKFDDIGCMLTFMKGNEVEQAFVRDYHSHQWLKLDDAYIVQENGIETPMSYGFIAFKEKADAATFTQEHNGEIFQGMKVMDVELKRMKMHH